MFVLQKCLLPMSGGHCLAPADALEKQVPGHFRILPHYL
jgi:hypothetical protein